MSRFSQSSLDQGRFDSSAVPPAPVPPTPNHCWQLSVEPAGPFPVHFCASARRYRKAWRLHVCCMCFCWKIPCCVACILLSMDPCPVFMLLPCASWPNLPSSQRGCWLASGFSTGQWHHPPPEPQHGSAPELEVLPGNRPGAPSGHCVPSADGGCKNEVLVETPFLPPL